MPTTAMVLAAGYGKRMLPLTEHTPKPLLEVGGRSMLDQALDRLVEAGVTRAVVNVAHLGRQIESHLRDRRDLEIVISREDAPLETGGGVKHALAHLGDDPVFIINADLPWRDGVQPALHRLANKWDAARMDELLLVMPLEKARGFTRGDFMLLADGRLQRAGIASPLTHVFIGAQIVKPELYHGIPEKVFSNNMIFNNAETAGRLYGLVHDGACYHVGTPEDLAEANALLASGAGWDRP